MEAVGENLYRFDCEFAIKELLDHQQRLVNEVDDLHERFRANKRIEEDEVERVVCHIQGLILGSLYSRDLTAKLREMQLHIRDSYYPWPEKRQDGFCEWQPVEDESLDDAYLTSCRNSTATLDGHLLIDQDSSLAESGFKFCPWCGGRINAASISSRITIFGDDDGIEDD